MLDKLNKLIELTSTGNQYLHNELLIIKKLYEDEQFNRTI